MPAILLPDEPAVVVTTLVANQVQNLEITGPGVVTIFSTSTLRYAYGLVEGSTPDVSQAYFEVPANLGREIGLDPRDGRLTLSVWSTGVAELRVDRGYR